MDGTDHGPTLERIGRALARLEALAVRPSTTMADGALAARHDRLRATVADALARLDALLGEDAAG